MDLITLTKDNFDSEVLQAKLPVVIDFWAPWCGYCRRLSPAIDWLAKEYDGQLIVGKINIDEQPELAEKFQVETIPTLLVFQNGKEGKSIVAPETKSQIITWLKENEALA